MSFPTKNQVKKLGMALRILASFILICATLAGLGLIYAMVTEAFDPFMLLGIFIIGVTLHITTCIVVSGYAPKYLLFTHGPKDVD